MQIILTDSFRKDCQNRFHIADSAALSTIHEPDNVQRIRLDEKQLTLYFKKEVEDGYSLLLSSLTEREYLSVNLGFKIPPYLVDDISSATPLDILRNLAIKFGLIMRIGSEANKFIFQSTIPVSRIRDQTRIVEIMNPKGHSFVQSVFVRPNYDLKTIDCALAFCIDLDNYCDWLESLPKGGIIPSANRGIELAIWHFDLLKKMLTHELFPANWFDTQRNSSHPAYHEYSVLANITDNIPLRWPEQQDEIPRIGKTIFNLQAVLSLLGGDASLNEVGSVDSFFVDDDIRKNMRARILDRAQYEPLIVELATASWCKENGYAIEFIKPLQGERSPDLLVCVGPSAPPLIIECKCITTQSIKFNPRKKLNRTISDANKQIRDKIARLDSSNGCRGVVVIDVTIPFGIEQAKDDLLPKAIEDIKNNLELILSIHNKSIGTALLIWEDYVAYGTPPDPTYYAARRRFLRIDHKAPSMPIPSDLLLFQGKTLTFWAIWGPKSVADQ